MFVAKFKIYSETENPFVNGRKGETITLLPPVTLYKEFINIISENGDHILMQDTFIKNHKIVFWNIVLYLKILKLPYFMLDLDYSSNHQKVHCSQIKKFLPYEKPGSKPFFKREGSFSRAISNKLNSSALKKLNEQHKSPVRPMSNYGGTGPVNVGRIGGRDPQDSDQQPPRISMLSNGRPSSINRISAGVKSIFSAKKNTEDTGSGNQDINPVGKPAILAIGLEGSNFS